MRSRGSTAPIDSMNGTNPPYAGLFWPSGMSRAYASKRLHSSRMSSDDEKSTKVRAASLDKTVKPSASHWSFEQRFGHNT